LPIIIVLILLAILFHYFSCGASRTSIFGCLFLTIACFWLSVFCVGGASAAAISLVLARVTFDWLF
ncbi:hypothetical protein, partial [Okeania sp. SIO2C2]|uniref:hypothetical protein n=1 Tax=Okeania sp. SIO2C2 TaxID=2607787 RepID=UPI00257DE743